MDQERTRGARDHATVLVVDDEPRNRALVRAYLEGDYRVLEADSAASAFAALESERVDVVLLDVMMPGVSGLEACRRIKATQRNGFLPVLLLTALGEQEDRNAGLEAGADDFLTKPIDRRELKLRLDVFLRLREQEKLIGNQLEELRHITALKEDLVSILVHDLRNPLSGILGMLEVVREELGDAVHREDIAVALANARKLRATIEEILQVRLQEQGAQSLHFEHLPVGAVVRDAIASLEGDAKLRGLRLELTEADVRALPVDRQLLRRAVENLTANALKYSSPGQAVEVSVTPAPGGVLIEVADRGPGVPDEVKPKLFAKFASVELAKSAARRGFGLGLYSAKLAASAHGGRVSVRDREDGGAVFGIFLPIGGLD